MLDRALQQQQQQPTPPQTCVSTSTSSRREAKQGLSSRQPGAALRSESDRERARMCVGLCTIGHTLCQRVTYSSIPTTTTRSTHSLRADTDGRSYNRISYDGVCTVTTHTLTHSTHHRGNDAGAQTDHTSAHAHICTHTHIHIHTVVAFTDACCCICVDFTVHKMQSVRFCCCCTHTHTRDHGPHARALTHTHTTVAAISAYTSRLSVCVCVCAVRFVRTLLEWEVWRVLVVDFSSKCAAVQPTRPAHALDAELCCCCCCCYFSVRPELTCP